MLIVQIMIDLRSGIMFYKESYHYYNNDELHLLVSND